ncbi:MAG: thiolase family protein [Nocardioidaceae bacterium]
MTVQGIAVVGVHHTPARREVTDQSLEEMVFAAARGALTDAGLTIEDIDSVILSTTDQVEGRVIESMVTNGAAGGVGRDVTTIASAGEHAFTYAYLRLRAGQASRALVVVWSKESESVDPTHADLLGAEPFTLRPLGMTSVVAAGLQASAYAHRHGLDAEVVRNVRAVRAHAAFESYGLDDRDTTDLRSGQLAAWPLTMGDLPRGCDIACAVVLSVAESVTSGQTPAWITGVGWVTERYDLGERDLSRFEALEGAARMALGEDGSARHADVVEVQEISAVAGFAACEALGLAGPGKGSHAATTGSPVVNPSGGNLLVNPGNAAGVLRFVAAAQQVRGKAGAVQVSPPAKTAVGAALHGFAGQGAAVVLFAAEENEVA